MSGERNWEWRRLVIQSQDEKRTAWTHHDRVGKALGFPSSSICRALAQLLLRAVTEGGLAYGDAAEVLDPAFQPSLMRLE